MNNIQHYFTQKFEQNFISNLNTNVVISKIEKGKFNKTKALKFYQQIKKSKITMQKAKAKKAYYTIPVGLK